MKTIEFRIIEPKNILTIIPLLKMVNNYTPEEILKKRVLEMVGQNYKCVGMYDGKTLIGISGLWFLTRHYCGKTVEPDHVIIDENYRNMGIGKKLFEWIYKYAKNNGIEASELNTFISNTKSHKFYENEGYKRLGYHYLKIL
ncbi:GNAT family N-acetyltransferase [Lutibacter sp.]|uniref:GNAT family N-acetyltransferase n=1 Tax=Lutibacter sp. TaxID=1925666 RepID=UPI0027347174|nr:GNAT family N-acetyltransferase [Lutibacter sp.]MDP3312421.1 GNAT family N-acetyltransferase [Lutibacter sp.]